jgi:hypothetical protein
VYHVQEAVERRVVQRRANVGFLEATIEELAATKTVHQAATDPGFPLRNGKLVRPHLTPLPDVHDRRDGRLFERLDMLELVHAQPLTG